MLYDMEKAYKNKANKSKDIKLIDALKSKIKGAINKRIANVKEINELRAVRQNIILGGK